MLDLQDEPKGLSIGGLVVINKSMSLTVRSLSLLLFAVICLSGRLDNQPLFGK